MKIVYFGTSIVGLPILEQLHAMHEIVHIVTSPDAPIGRKQVLTETPIATFATSHNIPVSKPEKVKNNQAFLEQLAQLGADIFIVVSYGKILPHDLIETPPLKTLNIHFSLLPQYRGASPIQFSLLNGDTTTGTTIFILDEHMDTGPILAQKSITINPHDTFTTLAQKLSLLSAELLIELLPQYQQGLITLAPQDNDQATYVTLIKKEDGKIAWDAPASAIYNRYRAFVEWPGIWTTWNGKLLKILDCEPGELIAGTPGATHQTRVVCGQDTTLILKKVQLEGKTAQDIDVFLRGYPHFSNTQLGS